MGALISKPEPKNDTGPVQPIIISPWREFEFSDSELDNLRDKIEIYSPRSTLSVPDARILLIGPVGSGKSSFVNTINSIFNDTITNQTNSGKTYNSRTTVYRQHHIQSKRKEGCLRFQLCDTPGLQENFGPSDNNIMHLFEGKLPDGCQVSCVDVNPNIAGFNKRPELKDQVHCVVFVLDATTLEVLGHKTQTQLHSLLRELNKREIPKVVVLTKIDEFSKMVGEDVSNVFRCPRVKAAVKRVAEVLGVTLNTVHPIKNYENEIVLNAKISQLAIVALDQIIGFADNFLVKKRAPNIIKPWRDVPDFNDQLDNLRDKIENYSPRSTLSVPDARILLIGPVGSGKSSFVNTINSIFNDTITNQANSGKSYNSLTTVYRQHHIQSKRKEGCLRFQLCDTPGLQENFGPSDNNIMHLFEGKLPDGCQVSCVDVNPNIAGFNKRPELKDQVHCVVFVLDATTLEVLGHKIQTQLHSLLRELNKREIPKVVVLTKIDELSKMVGEDVSHVFRCPIVKAAVKRVSEMLGVTLNTVHPIKNYENELVLNAKISQLAIVALDQIIGFADNFLVNKRSPNIIKPWRDVPDFNDQNRTTLMSKIANFSIPPNVNVPEARILMIGPVGAGKSSFFNTINSIFNDRITNQSNTGSADSSLTTVYRQYQVRCGLNGHILKFRICDTCGIEEKKGPCLTDLVYLLEGNVPDGYAFRHSSPIDRNMRGFVSHPRLKDKIHCVVFVLDASTVQVTPYLTWNKINQFQTELNRREIPKVIILTKIDTLSNAVNEDLSGVYQCPKVKKAVETVSATLGVPQHNIWPIKNYETEVCLNEKVSNLALLAFDQILGFANDFLIKKEASFRIDPWRDSLFTRETRTGLMARIESFNPPSALEVFEARILMIGPIGAGKSSFFNTINSIFNDRITNQSNTGSAASSLTTVYRQYKVQSGRTGEMLNFRLCDTCGIEETKGPSLSDMLYLLDGNVPDGYQFNPSSPIDPKIPGFIKRPRLKDQIHCVVFVFDASTVELVPKSVWTKVAELQTQINKKEIPKAVILTKIDKLAVIVEEDLSRVFECEEVRKAVEKMSDTIGLPRQNIWPIKNYESEIYINEKVNVLALGALDQILGFARDFLMKKEALLSFAPWRKAPPFTRENKLTLIDKIENYSPPSGTKLSQARILMIGPVRAGKSSFCNTINSIFSEQITHRSVVSGSATSSVTKEYRQFQFRSGRTRKSLKFCLCDTCGIAEKFGPDSTEMVYLVDGNIPDGYEFNPSSPITPEDSGFIHRPGLEEMVHCVVFVFDGSTLECIPPSVWDKLSGILLRMNKKGIPHVVLLTKIDEMVKDVDYNISRVYECTEIKMAVEKVSQMLGISHNDVMPIQNYVDEELLNDKMDNLALLAIHKVLGYVNEFALKRLDVKDARPGFHLDNNVVFAILAGVIGAALVSLDVKITLAFIFIAIIAMLMYRLYLC